MRAGRKVHAAAVTGAFTAHARRSRIGLAVAAALGVTLPHAPVTLAQTVAAASTSSTQGSTGLAEVVVTARKVEEDLQKVPVSVSVFTAEDMKNLNITQFEDYATRDPSISFISAGPGTQTLVIRGVSDGSNPNEANTSLTGFFLDDMSVSWFGVQPDLHLYDIERIEVLNGPQGTTFGAGSMSGAIRYITNKPNVNDFSAGIDFNAGQIQDAQQNWTYEGFLNVPIIQGILGFRASAFSDSHGGFVNNQLT